MSIEICPKCNLSFENGKYKKKYCSLACGNSRSWSNEHKEKLSLTCKKLFIEGKLPVPLTKIQEDKWETRKCLSCNNTFEVYKKKKKEYCSRKCNPKIGGYREGSGKSKSGYYKGIYCGSTYELAWVIYRLDHHLSVVRFPNALVCKTTGKKYIPDFLDDNIIVEIKGFENQDLVNIKTKIAEDQGYSVKILRKEDLTKQFEWVKLNYNVTKFEVLYDEYKPKFECICDQCEKQFFRDKKPKTNLVFCSQTCAGRFVANK